MMLADKPALVADDWVHRMMDTPGRSAYQNIEGHDTHFLAWGDPCNPRKHWNTNLLLSGDAKQASGTVYLMLLDTSTKPASIIFTGTYNDSLVKTKDGWRFAKRTTTADAPAGAPAAESK